MCIFLLVLIVKVCPDAKEEGRRSTKSGHLRTMGEGRSKCAENVWTSFVDSPRSHKIACLGCEIKKLLYDQLINKPRPMFILFKNLRTNFKSFKMVCL